MSQPYQYTDSSGGRLTIRNHSGEAGYVYVCTTPDVVLTPTERAKAAAALAGDGYRVVPVDVHKHRWLADGRCLLTHCDARNTDVPEQHTVADSEPVDPASVKVGDVVEVAWTVEGEVYMLSESGDPRHPFHIRGYGAPSINHRTTVRVVRPAPDPAEQEIAALAEAVGVAAGETTTEVRPIKWQQMARALHARKVRVVDDGGSRD